MSEEEKAPGPPPPDDERLGPSPEGEGETPSSEGESGQSPKSGDLLLREELEEALREKDQFRSMAQRAQADLVNYRRRVGEEMTELRLKTNSELLLKILSIVDDLERALSAIPEDAVAPGWLEGLNLVMRNIENLLDSEGVKKIEAVGQPFEPWELEAVQYLESDDTKAGTVTNVLRDGYRLHDKVLRAAQVVVAKEPDPEVQSEDPEQEVQSENPEPQVQSENKEEAK